MSYLSDNNGEEKSKNKGDDNVDFCNLFLYIITRRITFVVNFIGVFRLFSLRLDRLPPSDGLPLASPMGAFY